MKRPDFFLISCTLSLAVAAVICGSLCIYIFNNLSTPQLQALQDIFNRFSFPILGIVAVLMGVAGFGVEYVYKNYVLPLKKISSEASIIYSSNPGHRLQVSGSREIIALSRIINNFAEMFEHLNRDITEQILIARKETEKERNTLAAIMSELPKGVIICNKSGRIILFNTRAKHLFSRQNGSSGTEQFIGLGRSIFHLIDKDMIAHAIEEVKERLQRNEDVQASYFITPLTTGMLLSIETIPVLNEKKMTGFILAFNDISHRMEKHKHIEEWMFSYQQTLREQLDKAGLLFLDLTETYVDDPQTKKLYQQEYKKNYLEITHRFEDISTSVMDETTPDIPLGRLILTEFLAELQVQAISQAKLKISLFTDTVYRKILADSYSFQSAFLFLLKSLSGVTGLNQFDLSVTSDNGHIHFDISWDDRHTSRIQVENITTRKIKSLTSLNYVLRQNKASFSILSDAIETCSKVRITVKAQPDSDQSVKSRGVVISESRPEFYDFDLFRTDDDTKGLLQTDLKNIIFTVFDTETTGLDPDGGDEIISIGAVRIVNNRIVYHDIFEELIDPKRDIPIESYHIHGISYEMLKGKPDIKEILPLFNIYTYDTVLVGHNIAFDLKMMKVKEQQTQTRITNPVLDTLLLSAVLNPMHRHHDMENIAKRLGVEIIGRHTALGDAIATAEIFLKLIPLLNANGIFTLKNALDACKRTYYARLKY